MITSSPNSSSVDDNWVQVVRSVLPQVPIAVIRRELQITKNVDDTIARILDGTVYYEPEVPTVVTEPSPPVESTIDSDPKPITLNNVDPIDSNAPSPMSHNTKAISFDKNPRERMKSYHERKEQLLQVARKHFIEKHGLQSK
jgi:ancient ubiquitous protein 1